MPGSKWKRLEKDKYLLYTINQASPQLRKAILKNCPSSFIKTISEICFNVLKGNCHLDKKTLNVLKKYKKKLRSLASCSSSAHSKRSHLVQSGNGFLPFILAPLIGELFRNI